MIEQHFLSVTDLPELALGRTDVFAALRGGERVLWHGHAGVAEYAFEKAASLPKWTLPETTELMVTGQRVLYAHTVSDDPEIISGELRWLWPQHLRVQPGAREPGRYSSATQIQLVCGGSDGTWPALVLAGGDLRTAADADRVANLIRQSVARFRVDHATTLGLTVAQSRLLSRLLIGPEFSNYQGGPGETVSIPGALLVNRAAVDPRATPAYQPAAHQPAYRADEPRSPVAAAPATPTPAPVSPAPAPAPVLPPTPAHRASEQVLRPEPVVMPPEQVVLRPEPVALQPAARVDHGLPSAGAPPRPADAPARVIGEGATRVISLRPGIAADMARALQAAKAEAATEESEPDLASRAADLAARIASLVSASTAGEQLPAPTRGVDLTAADRFDNGPTDDLADRLADGPTDDLTDRAETVRRTAARFTANSARTRVISHRDLGSTSRGNRNP